ncbi:MAG: CDP-glycerol--glycerophosphate glycerophosphotransferase [Rhodospirillaceae bacterium]|nr:CDP-glycerol--glycerophosphate glycerophosphotransferase [Rhodospirillaceae bacterium]
MTFIRHLLSVIRFMQLPRAQRRLVFYSEGKNYWPHLEGLVRSCLDGFGLPVLYLTSDPDDPGLLLTHERLYSCNIGDRAVRTWLFANLDADVMVTTTPDLENFQLKRSRHRVHYVYVQHSMVSLHMIYRTGAFDHFDTIFCAGPHHCREARALEEQRKTPPKILVEHGYGRLAAIIAEAKAHRQSRAQKDPCRVLVAPSWGPNGIIETRGAELVEVLLAAGFEVILRPHPQTARLAGDTLARISDQHGGKARLQVENNVAGRDSLHRSDVMISDWSGAALEYALGLEKPVVFIDVPRKVNNPEYRKIDIDPIEVTIREKIGTIVDPSDLASLPGIIRATVSQASNAETLASLRQEVVFNIGTQDEIGARYLSQLLS